MFSVEGKKVNSSGFTGQTVSITTLNSAIVE